MKIRKLLSTVLVTVLLLSLAGCGSIKLTAKGEDRVRITVSFEKSAALKRCPHFRETEDGILMHFNGTVWYRARLIGREEAEEISSLELMAESADIRVYLNPEASRDPAVSDPGEGDTFLYLLDLEGTDDTFVLFTTDGDPGELSYWNDFSACVTYTAGKTVTVPDCGFEVTDAFYAWQENTEE